MARVKSTDRFPLLTSQRNSVLGLIRLAGLEPREFYWMDADSRVTPGATVDRLVHRPTDFFYEFDFVPNGGQCRDPHDDRGGPESSRHAEASSDRAAMERNRTCS
jgi:hypothetical protein